MKQDEDTFDLICKGTESIDFLTNNPETNKPVQTESSYEQTKSYSFVNKKENNGRDCYEWTEKQITCKYFFKGEDNTTNKTIFINRVTGTVREYYERTKTDMIENIKYHRKLVFEGNCEKIKVNKI
jgi:hypothetical protein